MKPQSSYRLRVGFIPSVDHRESDALAAELTAAIGRATGLPADVHRAGDYRGLVAALDRGVVHVAWVPPLIAAPGVLRRSIVPIAVTVRNGTTSYSAALITHIASGVRSTSHLKGLRAAWVDRESASGYTVIRMALRKAGVSLVDAFREEVFARSHAEVARLVYARKVDVGATYFSNERDVIARAGWLRVDGVPEDAIHVVAEAGPIPSDFFAVNAGVARELGDVLRAALVEGRSQEVYALAKKLLRTDGFMPPTAEHQLMLERLVESLGIDAPRER